MAKRRGGAHTSRAVVLASAGVVLALALAWGVASLAEQGDIELNLGADTFNAGDAEDVLDDILERGSPLGFNPLEGGTRPLWLDNLGQDPATGWLAVAATLPDDTTCAVQWDGERELYVADCDQERTFGRDGDGLRTYPVEVVDGDIVVDLNAAARR